MVIERTVAEEMNWDGPTLDLHVLSLFLEATEERQDGKIPWRDFGLFLTDAVAVVSGVKAFVVSGFGWSVGGGGRVNPGEVFSERTDGLDGQSCCRFDAVGYDWLPHPKPVLEMMDVCSVDVLVEVGGGGSKKDVAVGMQNGIAFIVEMMQSNREFAFPGELASFRIGSMDCFVAEVPHQEVFFPHRGKNGRGPKEAGGTVVGGGEVVKVLILEACPFATHSALEDLAPAESILVLNKAAEGRGIVGVVDCCGIEPGVKAIDEYID
jgi:hypothetical protein